MSPILNSSIAIAPRKKRSQVCWGLVLVPALLLAGIWSGTAPNGCECPSYNVPSLRDVSTLAPGVNGAIESITLITTTATSEYYAITYWSDGLHVAAFLGRPKEGGVHPAVIYNRGGHRTVAPATSAYIAPLVEAGFVAVASQYRGGAGSDGTDEFGGSDVRDVMNLLPLLKQQPDVDPERIGMMGHSRGGLMTYLALKEDTMAGSRDIKAAATVGGVADLFYMAEMRPRFVREVCAPMIGGLIDQVPAAYEARSATYWPGLINAPLLIQQGGADRRVPPLQSYRLASELQDAGKTVKLEVYHKENHNLVGEYWGYPEALEWFEKYLGQPGDDLSFESHRAAIVRAVNWFVKSG